MADVVSGILIVLLEGQSGKCYTIAGEEVISIRDFAELCANIGKVQVETAEMKGAKKPARDQILDGTETGKLGWKPYFDVK